MFLATHNGGPPNRRSLISPIGGLLMSGRRPNSDSGEPDLWSNGSVFMGSKEPISVDPSPQIPLQQTTAKGIEVWNLDKRRRIGTVRDGDQTPDFMSPDGRLLAGGVQHGEYPEHTVEDIRIRRTEDGSVIRMIDTAKDTGWPVWSPDGE